MEDGKVKQIMQSDNTDEKKVVDLIAEGVLQFTLIAELVEKIVIKGLLRTKDGR